MGRYRELPIYSDKEIDMSEFAMEVIVLGVILLLFVPVVVAMIKRKRDGE